jgi:hypothetical protein
MAELTMEEKLNAVIKILQTMKMDSRFCISDKIRNNPDYKELMAINKRDLPKNINNHDPDSPHHFIISCRLSGEDPIEKNLSKCIELLYNQEFSYEDYKNIGYNDGQASAVSRVFEAIGMNEDARQAIDATYNFD